MNLGAVLLKIAISLYRGLRESEQDNSGEQGGYKMTSKRELVIGNLQKQIKELECMFPIFNFDDYYFAGGCIYILWNEKEPKDYDIFCRSKVALNRLKSYIQSSGLSYLITGNAITIGKYQFIIRSVGEPEIEVRKFDFKHNMFYYSKDGLFCLSDWKYLDSNKLEFNTERARDVLNILSRIPKFVSRGMEISQAEVFEILEQGTRPTKYFAERKNIKNSHRRKSYY